MGSCAPAPAHALPSHAATCSNRSVGAAAARAGSSHTPRHKVVKRFTCSVPGPSVRTMHVHGRLALGCQSDILHSAERIMLAGNGILAPHLTVGSRVRARFGSQVGRRGRCSAVTAVLLQALLPAALLPLLLLVAVEDGLLQCSAGGAGRRLPDFAVLRGVWRRILLRSLHPHSSRGGTRVAALEHVPVCRSDICRSAVCRSDIRSDVCRSDSCWCCRSQQGCVRCSCPGTPVCHVSSEA